MVRRRALPLWLAALFFWSSTGCSEVVKSVRVQPMTVLSEPEGATIWIEEDGRRRVLGAAPKYLEITRDHVERRFDYANLWWPIGGGAGLLAGAALYPIAEKDERSFALVLAFVGLLTALGSMPGIIIGILQDGHVLKDAPVLGTIIGASLVDHEDDIRRLDNPNYGDASMLILYPTPLKNAPAQQDEPSEPAEPASKPRQELPEGLRPGNYRPGESRDIKSRENNNDANIAP